MKHLVTTFAVVSMLAPVMVRAGAASAFVTGNDLHDSLLSYDRVANHTSERFDPMAGMQAFGYIEGVADARNGIGFCISSGVTPGQIVAVTEKYLNAHPEQWNLPASPLVVAALKKAFPCLR